MLALAPPLSHTQWDRNKAAGRLYSLGSTPAGPEGGEPDAGVPFQGLSLVSGNPGVQRCRGCGAAAVVWAVAGWATRGSERPLCGV